MREEDLKSLRESGCIVSESGGEIIVNCPTELIRKGGLKIPNSLRLMEADEKRPMIPQKRTILRFRKKENRMNNWVKV